MYKTCLINLITRKFSKGSDSHSEKYNDFHQNKNISLSTIKVIASYARILFMLL